MKAMEIVQNVGQASDEDLQAALVELNSARDATVAASRRVTQEIADRAARGKIAEQIGRLSPAARESLKSAL